MAQHPVDTWHNAERTLLDGEDILLGYMDAAPAVEFITPGAKHRRRKQTRQGRRMHKEMSPARSSRRAKKFVQIEKFAEQQTKRLEALRSEIGSLRGGEQVPQGANRDAT